MAWKKSSMWFALWMVLCWNNPQTAALFDNIPTVFELTDENFQQTVMDSSSIWNIAIYVQWCPDLRQLESDFINASISLQGSSIKFGVIDAGQNPLLNQQFAVESFPAIFQVAYNSPTAAVTATVAIQIDEEKPVAVVPENTVKKSLPLLPLWQHLFAGHHNEKMFNEYYFDTFPEILIPAMILNRSHRAGSRITTKPGNVMRFSTKKAFNATINRESNHIWIITFCQSNITECENLEPLVRLAAGEFEHHKNLSNVHFGWIDGLKAPLLLRYFQIRKLPTMLVFDQRSGNEKNSPNIESIANSVLESLTRFHSETL